MSREPRRIQFLDGLRGLAILLVMGFHYVGLSYVDKLPYGNKLAWIPLLNHGWIGVYLFFLISGYVIFMTLEKCSTAGDFFNRRWLRLFPAMLVASGAIFIVSQVNGTHMPMGQAAPIDLLPGLTFIASSFWHAALHRNVHNLDGVFWTLYVEVAFYVVIATLYFSLGWKRSLLALIALWATSFLILSAVEHLPKTTFSRAAEPIEWIGFTNFGWFAAGALFFKARELNSNKLFGSAIIVAVLACFSFTKNWSPGVADYPYLFGCVALFTVVQRWQGLQRVFESRFFLFIGMISYPLYLLHCEIGVGLMSIIGPYIFKPAQPLLPVAMTAFICFLAWMVARHIEPAIRKILKNAMNARTTRQDHSAPSNQVDRPSNASEARQ